MSSLSLIHISEELSENKIVREKYLSNSFVLRKKDFQLIDEQKRAKEAADVYKRQVCPPSHFTVDHRLHYLYQEGRTVFRYAVRCV